MIETPKFPDNPIQVPAGTTPPRVAGYGATAITQLKPDMLLNALVLKFDDAGNPILKTPVGDITIATQLSLAQGSSVVMKVLVNNKILTPPPNSTLPYNFQAKIVTVDGQPPALSNAAQGSQASPSQANVVTALAISPSALSQQQAGAAQGYTQQGAATSQTQATQTPQPITGNNVGEAAIVRVSNGTIIDSVVVDVNRGYQPYIPQQQTAQLKPSDNLILHVLSAKIPEDEHGKNIIRQVLQPGPLPDSQAPEKFVNQSLSQEALSRRTNMPYQNMPYTTSPPPAVVLPGQENLSSQKSTMVQTQATQITNNQTFTATVVGTEKSGEVVLKTPVGILKLDAGFALPKGAELLVEALRVQPASTGVVIDRAGDLGLKTLLEEQRILMTDLVITALRAGPQSLDAIRDRIPTADKQFVAKMLWFLAGVRTGNERLWLGNELTQQLEKDGRHDLLSNLRGHMASLGKMAEGLPSSNWNVLLFPVFDGSHLQHALMYIHRDREQKDKKRDRSKDGERFIVEAHLSHLGDLQIDGFIKQIKNSKEMDVYIRTKQELDKEIESGIREIFITSLEITGISGNIQFQVVEQFPVNPAADLGDNTSEIGTILA